MTRLGSGSIGRPRLVFVASYGNAIRHCRAELLDLVEKAITDTVHHAQARKCLVELDRLRTELEIHLHGMVPPRHDPRHLRTSVYSGQSTFSWKRLAREDRARDAFASWDVGY
ncbi:hypothetical protein CCR78_00110 [Rhodovulum imhoffii]|nr:hypothetical protein [Rhodovulum imhoffii]